MSEQHAHKKDLRLFMVLLGCRPKGRLTEQHDIFFGIAASLKELVPHMKASWPEAKGEIHIDSWREVTQVGNYAVQVLPKMGKDRSSRTPFLFFINLGGYKPGEFEEYHYKMLAVGKTMAEAIQQSKQAAFYKHYGFKGAGSHVDDKYGIDMDELFKVTDVLDPGFKEQYSLHLVASAGLPEDELHIGYLPIKKLLAS